MSRLDCIEKLRGSRPSILPSMLLCDFANLENEIRKLESAGFQTLHLDIMDGVFVPNFTYGMTIVKAIRQSTDLLVDCHLMMVEPEKYISQFRDAGADIITVHAEATDNLESLLNQIKEQDAVAGVAVNPSTPISKIEDSIQNADLFLAMSVNAGFGGQAFMESVLPKFQQARELAGEDLLLQIDGGINTKTIATAAEFGVELFVVGSGVFKTDDYEVARNELRSRLRGINERI